MAGTSGTHAAHEGSAKCVKGLIFNLYYNAKFASLATNRTDLNGMYISSLFKTWEPVPDIKYLNFHAPLQQLYLTNSLIHSFPNNTRVFAYSKKIYFSASYSLKTFTNTNDTTLNCVSLCFCRCKRWLSCRHISESSFPWLAPISLWSIVTGEASHHHSVIKLGFLQWLYAHGNLNFLSTCCK